MEDSQYIITYNYQHKIDELLDIYELINEKGTQFDEYGRWFSSNVHFFLIIDGENLSLKEPKDFFAED